MAVLRDPTFLDTALLRAERLGRQAGIEGLDAALTVLRAQQLVVPTLLDGMRAALVPEAWSGAAATAAHTAYADESVRLAQAAADLDDAVAAAEAQRLALADDLARLDAEILAVESAATAPAAP